MTMISKGAALRIALAARALEGVDARAFTLRLAEKVGLPIDEGKLAAITVAEVKQWLTGEDTLEPEQDMAALKRAVRYLWGENGDDADVPRPEPLDGAPMPGSLRVAVASNTGENLDGHFGSAPRFLIYQVSRDAVRLIDVRSTQMADEAEDKNVARSRLIDDCQIVYVQSIGGPAAAKVVRAGVHPVKFPGAGSARAALARLQAILDAPPPWLAKILGVEAKSLAAFRPAEEEA